MPAFNIYLEVVTNLTVIKQQWIRSSISMYQYTTRKWKSMNVSIKRQCHQKIEFTYNKK